MAKKNYVKYKKLIVREMKKMKKLSEVKKTRTNPFMLELKGKMYLQPRANTIIAKGQSLVDTNTGEILKEEQVLLGSRKVVDKSQFAKLYASEIGVLYELSKPAQNVFLYLSKIMDYDNLAYLHHSQDYKEMGYKSYVQVIKGLRELITNKIIHPSVKPHHYWLNPTIVCKGERFAKYTEYVMSDVDTEEVSKPMLSKQGKEHYENMDNATGGKISAMNGKQTNLFDQIAEIKASQKKH